MEDVIQHLKQIDYVNTICSTNLGVVKWNRNNANSVSTYRKERKSELDRKWISSLYRYYADLLDVRVTNKDVQANLNWRISETLKNIKNDAFVQ